VLECDAQFGGDLAVPRAYGGVKLAAAAAKDLTFQPQLTEAIEDLLRPRDACNGGCQRHWKRDVRLVGQRIHVRHVLNDFDELALDHLVDPGLHRD
jgi:hypothetical protein